MSGSSVSLCKSIFDQIIDIKKYKLYLFSIFSAQEKIVKNTYSFKVSAQFC